MLQYNKNFTVTEILEDLELFAPVDFRALSGSSSVCIKNILMFPDDDWNWLALTRAIPLDDIYANLELPWDIDILSDR